jgi:hypothetical protein
LGDDAAVFKLVFKLMRKLDPLGGIRELTELEDILGYFSANTPDDFDIRAGAVLRQYSGGSYMVAQCYLNRTGALSCDSYGYPYGRLFRTLDFDQGLHDLFGQQDLIVFT